MYICQNYENWVRVEKANTGGLFWPNKGWTKKVRMLIFAITCLLSANIHNFWLIYTVANFAAKNTVRPPNMVCA